MINNLFFASSFKKDTLNAIKKEVATTGHYALPEQDTSYIKKHIKNIISSQPNIEFIVVIGIGGSSLGAQAIYEFLKTVHKLTRKLYFLDSTNPVDINNICAKLNFHKTHFVVISKSGDTIEVMAIYKYLLAEIKGYNLDYYPFSFISAKNSKLISYAKDISANYLEIATNISGRFSVLSAVGLVPLSLVGINIDKILLGAKIIKDSFFNNDYMASVLLKKSHYYAKNCNNININVVFCYSQSLHFFNDWFVQLWGESLAKLQKNSKTNIGLTPMGLIGPKDQHSFLQLLVQGKRDKSVSFIKLKSYDDKSITPSPKLDKLLNTSILNNILFSQLIDMQADATIEFLTSYDDIPIDVIELESQDESNIGQLIYYFELLTSLVGHLLNINTYNQPSVEDAKLILKDKLKKHHAKYKL